MVYCGEDRGQWGCCEGGIIRGMGDLWGGMRYLAALPTVVLAVALIWGAAREPDADLVRAMAHATAESDAQATLHREAEHATQYFAAQHDVALTYFKQRLIEQVDTAYAFVDALHTAGQGLVSDDQLKTLTLESLRTARFFEGRGYYFVGTEDGVGLLMPMNPDEEGKSLLRSRDDLGTYTAKGLLQAARQPGGAGFFTYRWFSPDSRQHMDEKVSYVRSIPTYGWVIGTGDYLPTMESVIVTQAAIRLGAIHFGRSGAIGLSTRDGEIALFPEVGQQREGNALALQSAQAQTVWAQIRAKAHQGGGFISFPWPDAVTGRLGRRLAWVQNASATERIIYASADLADFIPPPSDFEPAPFLTVDRAVVIALLAVSASLLCLWLFPGRRHGS